jgi:hypothetical protein
MVGAPQLDGRLLAASLNSSVRIDLGHFTRVCSIHAPGKSGRVVR